MENVANAQPLFRDKRRRAWELDFLRGVAVIAMCFDHLMWDFYYARQYWFSNFKQINNEFINKCSEFALAYLRTYESRGFRFFAHEIFVFLFLFLVGVSCAFSRDNAKRGARLAVVALMFTGVSFILKSIGVFDDGIIMGILHCIALSIICAAAVDKLTEFDKNLNTYMPLVLGVIIFEAGIFCSYWDVPLDPEFDASHLVDYIMGAKMFGDDYFGLFPYVGIVLIGMYWGKAAYPTKSSLAPRLGGKWNTPFNFVGRHALIMYLVHQVVIAGVVIALCLCLGYRF